MIKFLCRRDNTRRLILKFLIALLLLQSKNDAYTAPIVIRTAFKTTADRTYRPALYIDLRLEEARDCIYRLPPPGNTIQTRITQFFDSERDSNVNYESVHRTRQTINVLQWDAQSLNEAKAHELAVLSTASKLDVLCISELGHRRSIPGFQAISTSSTGTQSGVFCRTGLPSQVVELSSLYKFEELGIQAQMCQIDNQFFILHVYIAPHVPYRLRKQFWSVVRSLIGQYRSKPLMITGDLNTLSSEISENHTGLGHEYFANFVQRAQLSILNDNTPTRGMNSLDVTMCNDLFLKMVNHWQVLEELDSDHLPTLTQTAFKSSVRRHKGYHTIYRYLDITQSVKNLKMAIQNEKTNSSDLSLAQFHELVQANLCYKSSNKPGVAFWTPELTKLKRKRNKARKKLRASTEHNRQYRLKRYETARKEFRAMFRHTKQNFQQLQVERIASQVNSSETWKLTKSILPGTRKRGKKWITNTTHAFSEANEIAKTFAAISSDPSIQISEEQQHMIQEKIYELNAHSFALKPISLRELHSAGALANTNSAPGEDGISNQLLLAILSEPFLGKLLCKLFNKVLTTSEFPETMKVAKIKALPKQVSKQYRPISLLPNMGKLLERIITSRIREQVASKIHPAQQGCRAAHGTSTALARLLHQSGINAAKSSQHFGIITFDFSKAYDRVNRLLLIEKLINLGVDTSLVLLVNNWLQDRSFFVQHRGFKSDKFELENGIPQGSALSVLLWIIYVNDLQINADTSNIYVDDVIIWASGSSRSSVLEKLTNQADIIASWSKLNRVKINFDKTELLINDYKLPCSIRIDGKVIKNKRKTRYLGVDLLASSCASNCILDYDLKSAAGDIKRRCSIIKPMIRLGFTQRQIEIVCSGFIGGKLRYYTPWIGADLHNSTKLDPLVKAYNQMMRIMCQAICTTPISLLHAGSRFPLLSDVIKQDCTRMVLSSIASNNQLRKDCISWDGKGDG